MAFYSFRISIRQIHQPLAQLQHFFRGVAKRDLTGSTKGVIKKSYYDDAGSPGSNTSVANAFEESTIGQGANWPVLDDGQGSNYEAKLAEARTLVGFPS